jgi:exopolysaccharide biosynthesis protein
MTVRVRTLSLVLVIALGCSAAVAGFALRPPLQRAYVLWNAERATGLSIDVDAVEPIDGGYELDGVSAHTRGGAASVSVPRAAVYFAGPSVDVVLADPQFVFDPERYRGDEIDALHDALSKFGSGETGFQLHARDGTLTIVSGAVPIPLLRFERLTGSLDERVSPALYDLTANLIDGERSYPLAGQTVVRTDGSIGNRWTAPFVPLGPLGRLFPAGELRILGGALSDVALENGAGLDGAAQLEDGSVALGAHLLSGLHGRLQRSGSGIGSRDIVGTLDGVPFDVSGEVHDLRTGWAWLQDGSSDLRALGRLIESIAGEPRLRSVHLETTAPGVAFAQYAMASDHGPLAVSLLAIDPNEPTLRFDTAIAEDRVISGGERTSAMGLRTGAVAGVNGDYFDIGRTYQPQGLLVRGGELIRGPVDRAALSIDRSNHVTISEFRLQGAVHVEGRTFPITQFNDWPAGYVTLITPTFGKTLPPELGASFAGLEPIGVDGKRYRVVSVQRTDGPLPVTFGLAFGPLTKASVRPGETLELSYKTDPPLDTAVAAIGGGPILVRNGVWYEDPHAPAPDERNYRWPVIALARRADDGLLLVAVDGRHPERSIGMMRPEFAELLVRLGAADAMALDSGGSVTMVSRAVGDANVSVRNVPSDNSAERWVSDALFLYSSAPAPSIVAPLGTPLPVPEARPTP